MRLNSTTVKHKWKLEFFFEKNSLNLNKNVQFSKSNIDGYLGQLFKGDLNRTDHINQQMFSVIGFRQGIDWHLPVLPLALDVMLKL